MFRAIPLLLAAALQAQAPETAPTAAPTSANLAIIQRQMDAYNAHDAQAYAACFTADAQFVRHPGITALSGHDEIYKAFAKFFREHKAAKLRVFYRSELGPTTVIEHQVTEGADQNALPGLVIYKIQNGLIAAAWIVPAE